MTASSLYPYQKVTPTKTSDGRGGFTNAFTTPTTLYGQTEWQQNEMSMLVRHDSDVSIGDYVIIDTEYYEVMKNLRVGTGMYKRLALSKDDKPTG